MAFFVIAAAISWAVWLPIVMPIGVSEPVQWLLYYAGVIGPTAAAFLAPGVSRAALVRRIFHWRVHPVWYCIAVALPFAVQGLAVLVSGARMHLRDSGAIVNMTLLLLVLVPFEEIGWRGVALPLLQQRYRSLTSSLIVALMWAAWHLPLAWASVGFQRSDRPWAYMLSFTLTIAPISCLATWLFMRTKESIAVVSLYHVAVDLAGYVLLLPAGAGEAMLWTATAVNTAIVAVVFRYSAISHVSDTRSGPQL